MMNRIEGLKVEDTVSGLYQEFKNNLDTIISSEQLEELFPHAKQEVLNAYLPELNSQLNAAGINTPKRLAYFFATVNEETGGMTNFVENNFRYSDPNRARSLFRTNFSGMSNTEIQELGSGETFANRAYAHRNGNGDVSSGDGYLYRGRGLFNYTGRANYQDVGGTDFVNNPDLALMPASDVKAAITYWSLNGLSEKVDLLTTHINVPTKGDVTDHNFQVAVRAINRGLVNINRRATSYNRYIDTFNK